MNTMASLNMKGPYPLTDEEIDKRITKGRMQVHNRSAIF